MYWFMPVIPQWLMLFTLRMIASHEESEVPRYQGTTVAPSRTYQELQFNCPNDLHKWDFGRELQGEIRHSEIRGNESRLDVQRSDGVKPELM